jgi:aryl-alcohol dehydrogenase-like predicted oxidoreductase
MRYLEEAKVHGLPRMVSVQNPYSLLNRSYEVGSAEVSMREDIGLLPYSPLAFGVLSGKYLGGMKPAKGRVTLFPQMARYSGENSAKATQRYFDLAQKHGLSLTQMALAFVNTRPFVTSNIIGATTMDQLKENIGSIDVSLSKELLLEIEAIHNDIPDPAP